MAKKRTTSQAYILIWLETIIQPDEIDLIISAEISNQQDDPLPYDIVRKKYGTCALQSYD